MIKKTIVTYKFTEGNTTVTITESPSTKTLHVEEFEGNSFQMRMKDAQNLRDILNEATKEGLL